MSSVYWPELSAGFPFWLAVVAEEVGDDFAHMLGVAKELGIEAVEFGTLWGEPVAMASVETLRRAKDLLAQYEIEVCAISPTTFKSVVLGHVPLSHVEDEPHVQEELWLLQRQIAVAQFFDAPLVRVFSGRRESMVRLGNSSPRLPRGGPFPVEMQARVARLLQVACRLAEEGQVSLALENVRSCWANSGYNLASLVRAVDSPWLKVIWDPSNDYVSGEVDAYPTGYGLVKPYMAHIHVKDVSGRAPDFKFLLPREGALDYAGYLQAVAAAGYDGFVTTEISGQIFNAPGYAPLPAAEYSYKTLSNAFLAAEMTRH